MRRSGWPGPEVSVKFWIDDLDVKFADRSVLGQDSEGVVFRPLFRDNFNRYESVLFPREGGWLPGRRGWDGAWSQMIQMHVDLTTTKWSQKVVLLIARPN